MCPLFRDIANFVKITGLSMLFLVYYLAQQTKMLKLRAIK